MNTNQYTDRDMQILSQIAYLNLNELLDNYRKNYNGKSPTFEYLIKNHYDIIYNQLMGDNQNPEPGSSAEADYNWKLGVLELLKNDEKYSNWKLVGTSSSIDGFYAIMVETDPDNAVVAFRGTQMAEEFVQDLVLADLLLANNTETLQQESARTYITAINEQYDYSNYVTPIINPKPAAEISTAGFLFVKTDQFIISNTLFFSKSLIMPSGSRRRQSALSAHMYA